MIYYISLILIIYTIFILFLYLLELKIKKFENNILQLFKEKNNLIPSIFEVTKDYINKHNDIFNELISLKKIDFSENNFYTKLNEKANTYKKIHNELNFIFKVCNKHPKLNKDYKFLFVKDLIIDKSFDLGNKLSIYKKVIKKFNNLILIKNLTIIGLLIPIKIKETI